jgi:hypothetical protein
MLNTHKTSELEIAIWFLKCGYQVFAPYVDMVEVDLVIKTPKRGYLGLQIKHKQPDAKNEGRLVNHWKAKDPVFDAMIIYSPFKLRGVILSKDRLIKETSVLWLYNQDKDGYSANVFRPKFRNVLFDLHGIDNNMVHSEFVKRFEEIMELI